MIPYHSAPRMPAMPSGGGGGLPYAFDVGMRIGDAVSARREKRKLQKLLAKGEPFEREDFMEMAAINPLLAKEVMDIDRSLKQYKDEDRARALSGINDTINLTADIAYRMSQVPPEQREQVLATFIEPMAQNPALKDLGRMILRQFASPKQPGQVGPSAPDFSDERLTTMLGVASGLDTYIAGQQAKQARELSMIEGGRMPPSVLKQYTDMGYSEQEAAALWDPENAARTVESAEGDQSVVGIGGTPLFTGSGPQLPPGGGDVQMVSPEMFTGDGQRPAIENAGTPPAGGGGWIDRLGNMLTPRTQTPNPNAAPATPGGPGPAMPGANMDPIQATGPVPEGEALLRTNYDALSEAQRLGVREGTQSLRQDANGTVWIDDADTGEAQAVTGPIREFRDRLDRDGWKRLQAPNLKDRLKRLYNIPRNLESMIESGEWELYYKGKRGRLVRKGGTQAIPLTARKARSGGAAPSPGSFRARD